MSDRSGESGDSAPNTLSSRPSVPVLPALKSLKFMPCCDTYVRISAVVPVPPPGLLNLCEKNEIDLPASRGQGGAVAASVLSTLSLQLQNYEISILRKELCAPARYFARNGKEKSLSTSGSRKDIIPRILAWVQRYLDDTAARAAGSNPRPQANVPRAVVSANRAAGSTGRTQSSATRAPASSARAPSPSGRTPTASGRSQASAVRAPVPKAAPIAPAYLPLQANASVLAVRQSMAPSTTPIAPGPAPVLPTPSAVGSTPIPLDVKPVIVRKPIGPGGTSPGPSGSMGPPKLPSNGSGNVTENGGKMNTTNAATDMKAVRGARQRRENTESKRREGSDTPSKKREGQTKRRDTADAPVKRRKKGSVEKKGLSEKKVSGESKVENEIKAVSQSENSSGHNALEGDLLSVSKDEAVQAELKKEELALKRAEFTMRKESHDVAMRAAKCMALQKAVALEDECYKLIVEAERVVADAGQEATPAMHARVKSLYRKLETVQTMTHE